MSRFKPLFFRNLLSMLIIIFTLLFGIFIITNLYNNESNKPQIGGSFELKDQNGNIYSSKKVPKKKLIYFGYTFCPDVCPMDILKISNFIGKYPNIKKEIDFIFITVDPERDKPQVLREFLSNFNQEIIGLSGSNEKVSATLSKFRIYAKKNNTDSPKDDMYLVDHSSLIFFMDENDSYITHFNSKYFENQFTKYVN